MDQDLPEALRLADELENDHQWLAQEEAVHIASMLGAHAELRRQHAEIERLNAERDAMGRMMGARQDERDTLRAELDRWHSELSAVMRPDFKDWESVAERPTLAAWVITNQRERYAWAEGVIERLMKERDSLVRAVEIIAVGDAENPQAQAAEELIALGFWRDTPEAREITAPQPVKRLERELIDEIDRDTDDIEVESSGAMEFARAIETACAAAWGVKLEG